MKRKTVLLLPALLLASCSKNNTKGLVECSFISIDSQQNYEVFYYTIMPVFEYQSDDGKTICLDRQLTKSENDGRHITTLNVPVKVYQSEKSKDYVEYRFIQFVGYLLEEQRYFIDFDRNRLDFLHEYFEFTLTEQNSHLEGDTKEAYQKAKIAYYTNCEGTIYVDKDDKSLTKHNYIDIEDDWIIEYRPMA